MSDSESTDSDERIRYKTESVRNKSKKPDTSRINVRNVRQKDKDMCRYRKRHSRSSSPKSGYEKSKRKKNKISSRSSSTSSSDRSVKRKLIKNEPKQDDLINSQKIKSYVQNKAEPSLNKPKQIPRNEMIGPVLPPHLLDKKSHDCHTIKSNTLTSDYNIEFENVIKDNESLQRPLCSSFGPKLPSQTITSMKPEPIGPSLPVNIGQKNVVEQNQQRLQDSFTITHLLNSDKHSESEQSPKARLQSQSFPSSDRIIGPSLPPHLRKKLEDPFTQNNTQPQEGSQSLSLAASLIQSQENYADKIVGPSLPPHLQIEDPSESNLQTADLNLLSSTSVEDTQDTDQIRIGPSLPADLRKKLQEEAKECSNVNIESDEEDVYGPLPTGIESYSLSHKALEERALQLKLDQLKPKLDNEPGRESWMIELPTAKAANFGLGPRQFRNRSGPDLSDRSSWTDLPGDKNKKKTEDVPVDLKKEAELKELRKRDKEQEMLTRKYKRKEKSLLKMHKEQLEKEKKDEKSTERRPFSRDVDLQVNKFDDAQKQAIMKKAQLLDDRFSTGKSKFL